MDKIDPRFPHFLLINLDKRKDRLKQLTESFAGWSIPIERVKALEMTPGHKGCSASHKKCIQIAKERGWPWVVILEDDAEPTSYGYSQFCAALPWLWKNRDKWDIFNGGPTNGFPEFHYENNPTIFKLKKAFSMHFILVNASAYDRFAEIDIEEHIIDIWMNCLRVLCIELCIAVQKPGYSDIEKKFVQYRQGFKNTKTNIYAYLSGDLEKTTHKC